MLLCQLRKLQDLALSQAWCGSVLFHFTEMDNFIEIQFDYTCYSKNRKTPLFINNDELLALSYDGFYTRMISEIPQIVKVAATPSEPLRLLLVEENRSEIDLSPKYFKSQMMRILEKGLKTIVIRVIANESPLVNNFAQPTWQVPTTTEISRSRHRLDLDQTATGHGNIQVLSYNYKNNGNTVMNPKNESVSSNEGADNVILPLERHTRNHEKNIKKITDQLHSKTQELEIFDSKLSDACHQNGGHLSACGNCQLKLGHTRKACVFSPCRSAFSCGIITKHNDQSKSDQRGVKARNRIVQSEI